MVFITAEIGVNWNGDFELAKQMMIEAKNSGCNAVKFQSFDEQVLKENPLKNRLLKTSISQENIEEIDSIGPINNLKRKFNLVISDIAPNLSGIDAVDSENVYMLNKLSLKIANDYLDLGGLLVMKTFQNNMLRSLRKDMELSFNIVQTYKPAASKKQSGEIYLFGAK